MSKLFIFLLILAIVNLIQYSQSKTTVFHQTDKFLLLDYNKDGVLTMSDIRESFGSSFNEEEADLFFQEYDLNKDGIITLSEYLTKWSTIHNE